MCITLANGWLYTVTGDIIIALDPEIAGYCWRNTCAFYSDTHFKVLILLNNPCNTIQDFTKYNMILKSKFVLKSIWRIRLG